jgi:hypothetical protein
VSSEDPADQPGYREPYKPDFGWMRNQRRFAHYFGPDGNAVCDSASTLSDLWHPMAEPPRKRFCKECYRRRG